MRKGSLIQSLNVSSGSETASLPHSGNPWKRAQKIRMQNATELLQERQRHTRQASCPAISTEAKEQCMTETSGLWDPLKSCYAERHIRFIKCELLVTAELAPTLIRQLPKKNL